MRSPHSIEDRRTFVPTNQSGACCNEHRGHSVEPDALSSGSLVQAGWALGSFQILQMGRGLVRQQIRTTNRRQGEEQYACGGLSRLGGHACGCSLRG